MASTVAPEIGATSISDENVITAFHEAGHVVMAVALGAPLACVTIEGNWRAQGMTWVGSDYDHWLVAAHDPLWTTALRDPLWREALFDAAGMAAERLLVHSEADFNKSSDFGHFLQQARKADLDEEHCRGDFHLAIETAAKFFESDRPKIAVLMVARELIKHKTISRPFIDEIYNKIKIIILGDVSIIDRKNISNNS